MFSTVIKNKKLIIVSSCLIIFLLGIFRCNFAFESPKNNVTQFCDNKIHTVEGIIVEEPDERMDCVNLTLKSNDFSGKLLIRTDKYPKYFYGDKIVVEGKVQIPMETDDFSWRSYLFKTGVGAVSFSPKITLVQCGQGNKIYSWILAVKQYFGKKIFQAIPGFESQLLSALVLGYKNRISTFWRDIFSKTGTSHIVSVSGLHVSVVSGIILLIVLGLGISRKKSLWIVAGGLFLYSALIGFSPSVVRASIMGFLVLLAFCVGRMPSLENILAFAAAVMLLVNPLILRWDVGFQLSFLSVAGIFYLWPILQAFTENFPDPLKIKSAFMLSLSAQIITMPLVIYHFKNISVVSPIVNVIVVPFVPIIIILAAAGFIFIYLPIAILKFLFLPCKELLGFIMLILKWFSNIPTLNVSISWWMVVVSYAAIISFIFFSNKCAKLSI